MLHSCENYRSYIVLVTDLLKIPFSNRPAQNVRKSRMKNEKDVKWNYLAYGTVFALIGEV
jgi:hypothetical protein